MSLNRCPLFILVAAFPLKSIYPQVHGRLEGHFPSRPRQAEAEQSQKPETSPNARIVRGRAARSTRKSAERPHDLGPGPRSSCPRHSMTHLTTATSSSAPPPLRPAPEREILRSISNPSVRLVPRPENLPSIPLLPAGKTEFGRCNRRFSLPTIVQVPYPPIWTGAFPVRPPRQ
jgi:hypothetical protein